MWRQLKLAMWRNVQWHDHEEVSGYSARLAAGVSLSAVDS